MTKYNFIRRSMMVISFSDDGRRAIDQARHVLDMPDSSPRIKGLAAKQIAFGYALSGDRDASRHVLDAAMYWLAQPAREDDRLLGQRSVVNADLFAIFQATCDIYLGHGARVIPVLEPRLASLSRSSVRTATITRAKLARAYANVGQPAEACRLACETLHAIDQVNSLSARSELRRTVRVLSQWHGRSDVQDVIGRVSPACPLGEIPHLKWLFGYTTLSRPACDTVGTGVFPVRDGGDKIRILVVQTGAAITGITVRQHPSCDAVLEKVATLIVMNCIRVWQEAKPIHERSHIAERVGGSAGVPT